MTAATLTLTDFILQRIAEDEAVARDATAASDSYFGDTAANALLGLAESEGADTLALLHFGRHRPARVLAECEAKRRIVESCRADYKYAQSRNDDTTELAEEVLWSLAAVYSDHADYRDEWRP